MSIIINFDTGATSREELTGLAALIGHVVPVALPMAKLREYQRNIYSGTAIGGSGSANALYAPETVSEPTEPEALAKAAEPVAEDKPKRGRKPKEQPVQQAISTGEERINPEDDAETEAQDRADEEAEEKGEDAPVDERPISELILAAKSALGDYVAKHGTDAALEDGAAIFKSVLGDPKDGVWKWGLVAELPRERVLAVLDAWEKAAAANARFGA